MFQIFFIFLNKKIVDKKLHDQTHSHMLGFVAFKTYLAYVPKHVNKHGAQFNKTWP